MVDAITALKNLSRRLADTRQLQVTVATAIRPIVKKEFTSAYDKSRSLTGESWPPLKRPTGLKPVIGLRDFYKFPVEGNKIPISNSKYYATYHNTGTKFIPKRSPLPASAPKNWALLFARASKNPLEDYLRGALYG